MGCVWGGSGGVLGGGICKETATKLGYIKSTCRGILGVYIERARSRGVIT